MRHVTPLQGMRQPGTRPVFGGRLGPRRARLRTEGPWVPPVPGRGLSPEACPAWDGEGSRDTGAPRATDARASVAGLGGDPGPACSPRRRLRVRPTRKESRPRRGEREARRRSPRRPDRPEGVNPLGRSVLTAESERCLPLLAGAGKDTATNGARARCPAQRFRQTSACCFQPRPSCNTVLILPDSYTAGRGFPHKQQCCSGTACVRVFS